MLQNSLALGKMVCELRREKKWVLGSCRLGRLQLTSKNLPLPLDITMPILVTVSSISASMVFTLTQRPVAKKVLRYTFRITLKKDSFGDVPNLTHSLSNYCFVITSAKEIMFLPLSFCLHSSSKVVNEF